VSSSSARGRARLTLLGLSALTLAAPAAGRELWADTDGDRYITLGSALKSVLLVGDAAEPLDGASATGFWRLRFDFESAPAPWLLTQLSYEQRVLQTSGSGFGRSASPLLPPSEELPYRLVPLGSTLIEEPGLTYVQDFERLAVGVRGDWGQVTLGRQALGFGRSSFFTATDLLAPFGAFQVDQEWRAGVDAFDAELALGQHASAGVSVAAEPALEYAAVLGRVEGYLGDVDGALLGGKRSEDWMLGFAGSAQFEGAAFSAELAYFGTDGRGIPDAQLGERGILKAVAGAAYTFDVRGGLTWLLEAHYNGFGLPDVREDASLLFEPDWQARLARGDLQTLGQYALAASANLVVSEELTGFAYVVVSPVDGSGAGALGATHTLSERVSLDLNAFLPWGPGLDVTSGVPVIGSEYGIGAATAYASVRVYD
jgi:hypothetical protein